MPDIRTTAYTRRPTPDTVDAPYLRTELENIQRAVPGAAVRRIAVSGTQLVTDRTVLAVCAAPVTYTLLAPTLAPIFPLTVKNAYSSATTLTVAGTIDGTTNLTLEPGDAVVVQPDPSGTTWVLLEFQSAAARAAYAPGGTERTGEEGINQELVALLAHAFQRIWYLENFLNVRYGQNDLWQPDESTVLMDNPAVPEEAAVWVLPLSA